MGVFDRSNGGIDRHGRREPTDPALTDTGTLSNPRIRGVHLLGKVVVGHDLVGQGGADAGDSDRHVLVRSQAMG